LKLNARFAKIPRPDRSALRDRKGECQAKQKGSNTQPSSKIPRPDRRALRDRKGECQVKQKGSNTQPSYDAREPALSSAIPGPQQSSNNGKQRGMPLKNLNYMKYNGESPLYACKGLGLPSLKSPRNLNKLKKKLRRRLFRQKQKKKVTKQIQDLEISNMSKTSGDRINTNPYQRQLVKTSNGPSIC